MKQSAGLLVYRRKNGFTEFFLVHPGGPFWKNKEAGAWTIPKGEFGTDEDPLEAAQREFLEETGCQLKGSFFALEPIRQKSGKKVLAWAVEADLDENQVRSNSFSCEWPPRSGKFQDFPEVDKAGWFGYTLAAELINPAQVRLLQQLIQYLEQT